MPFLGSGVSLSKIPQNTHAENCAVEISASLFVIFCTS